MAANAVAEFSACFIVSIQELTAEYLKWFPVKGVNVIRRSRLKTKICHCHLDSRHKSFLGMMKGSVKVEYNCLSYLQNTPFPVEDRTEI